jgi:O-antigen/teichoic acid export membrane protein
MLEIFYGNEYVSGALVMSIFVFATLITSIFYVFSIALTSMKVVKLQIKILLVIVILNIFLNILLIPTLGMTGAAISFLISTIFSGLIFWYYIKKFLDFKAYSGFTKLLIASILTLVLVISLKPIALNFGFILPQWEYGIALYLSKVIYLAYLGFLTCISFTFFMLTVLLFKCFQNEDVILMRKVMQKIKIPEFFISYVEELVSNGVPKPV